MRVLICSSAVIVTCLTPSFAQTVNLRPGSYETTVVMEMPGGMKMAPVKDTQCVTAEDLKDFSKIMTDPEVAKTCKVSDYKVTGNTLTFRSDCKDDDVHATGTVEMTFSAESYTGVMTSKDDKGHAMTIKMSAKRIGECTK